jgi:hypothetical protein
VAAGGVTKLVLSRSLSASRVERPARGTYAPWLFPARQRWSRCSLTVQYLIFYGQWMVSLLHRKRDDIRRLLLQKLCMPESELTTLCAYRQLTALFENRYERVD